MKKKVMKGVPVYKAILVLVIAVLITVGVTSIIYSSYKTLQYKEIEIYLSVVEEKHIGFNLDPGVINFGKVPLGSKAKRNATVYNGYPNDILVRIDAVGNVKKMLIIEENYFILEPNVTKEIEIMAAVPSTQKLGNYSGKLKVYFERP